MDELKLMQDYFWILETCPDPDVVFHDRPAEKYFAMQWLLKLCNDIYRGVDAKRRRNDYLMKLSECVHQGELIKMFMEQPVRGPLSPLEGAANVKIDHKAIVDDMLVAAGECIPLTSPRHYDTHMSTKIFENNRGACAYLAVSLGDPKDGPIWSNKASASNSNTNVNVRFGEFCLDAIARELAGHAMPNDSPELETQLTKYANFIQKYPLDVKVNASTLSASEWRHYLLVNLQTDLIQGLEMCK